MVALSIVVSGCSPSMFFSESKPANSPRNGLDVPVYRRVNQQCKMDLSGDEMTAPVLRNLVRCFNSAGAMEKTAKLLESLSDQELQPIANWMGQELLSQPTRLYQLDESIAILEKDKKWVEILSRLGRILENEELLSSGLAMLREGLRASQRGSTNLFLKSIEKTAPEITDARVKALVDFVLPVAESRAVSALVGKVASAQGGSLTVQAAAQASTQFLTYTRQRAQAQGKSGPVSGLLSTALARIQDQTFFEFLDSWLGRGTTGEAERDQSARLAALLDLMFSENARLGRSLFPLVWAADQPMACFRDTQNMPHLRDALVSEWTRRTPEDSSRYMARDAVLELVMLQPYCRVRSELSGNIRSMQELALKPEWEVMSELLTKANQIKRDGGRSPLVDFVFQLMGDLDRKGEGGVLAALPLMVEAKERGLFVELLLAATAPRIEDRVGLARDLRFLSTPHADLEGQSIVDVLTDVASFAKVDDLASFYGAVLRLVRSPDPLVIEFLHGMREALNSSNVHPGLDLVRATAAKATKNQALFETLLGMASRAEFKAALKEMSEMAKPSDGRMHDLMSGMLGVLRQYSRKGQVEVKPLVIQPIENRRHHNYAGVDAPRFPSLQTRAKNWIEGEVRAGASLNSCLEVDPQFVWDKVDQPGYRAKIEKLAICLEADSRAASLASGIRFMADSQLENGRSFLNLSLEWMNAPQVTRDDTAYLSGRILAALGEGKVDRFVGLLPLLISREFAAKDGTRGTVLRPVMDLARPLLGDAQIRASLSRTLKYSSVLLRMPELQRTILAGDQIWDLKPEPELGRDLGTPAAIRKEFDFERIKRWVSNKECTTLPPAGTEEWERARTARAEKIVREYLYGTQNEPLALEGGTAPTRWNRATLRARLQPLLERVKDPETRGHFIRAFIQFARAFTRKEGEGLAQGKLFTQDEMFEFLRSRSNDKTLVTFFYKSDPVPRVRLLSSMDRLEVMLESADIYPGSDPTSEVRQNFGLSLIGDVLAKAWGSEPREVWPSLIAKEFSCKQVPRPKCPRTLQRAYNELLETTLALPSQAGLPDQPTCNQVANPADPAEVQREETTNPTFQLEQPPVPCTETPEICAKRAEELAEVKRKAFNIGRVIPVLTENMPGSGHVHAGGMRILRHLMFEVLASSLPKHQNDEAVPGNNLVGVWELARAGGLRVISELLYGVQPDDEVAKLFFRGLISVAQSPQAERLLEALLVGAGNEKLVDTIYQVVFNFVEAARGQPSDPVRLAQWERASPNEREVLQANWNLELARLKQTAVYGVLLLPALGHSESNDLASRSLASLVTLLGGEHREFWSRQGQTLEKILREPRLSWLLRSAVEAVAQEDRFALGRLVGEMTREELRAQDLMKMIRHVSDSPGSSGHWDRIWDRTEAMSESDEFKRLQLRPLVSEVLGFVGGRSGESMSLHAARSLLEASATFAERGDFEQVLWLMTQKPDDFERALGSLGMAVDRGSVGELLGMARTAFGK